MGNVIEGRWLIDFGNDDPANPAGNEIVLGSGVVALATDGKPIGRYEIERGRLTVTLPMPAMSGEGEWQMLAQFALPEDLGPHSELIGVMHGVVPGDKSVAQPCVFRRRSAQA